MEMPAAMLNSYLFVIRVSLNLVLSAAVFNPVARRVYVLFFSILMLVDKNATDPPACFTSIFKAEAVSITVNPVLAL
jgi:hypothetical protein